MNHDALMARVHAAIEDYEENEETNVVERQYTLLEDIYRLVTVRGFSLSEKQVTMVEEVLAELGF
jgi:hypothetical protein